MSCRAVAGSALLVALGAVVLTGCTSAEPDSAETPTTVQSPTPSPTADPAYAAETEPIDTGSIDGAEGQAVFYDGALVGYVVTYGDLISAIEQRFGVVGLASINRIEPESIGPGQRLRFRDAAKVPHTTRCI